MAGSFTIRIMARALTLESVVEWACDDGEGRRSGRATLGEAAERASGHRVTLLVPGGEVITLNTTLPTRRRAELRKALPYLLEEQLAEDVERLHFAVGAIDRELNATVAVIARETLEQWMAPLHELGLSPLQMVPDGLALASGEGTASLLQAEEEWIYTSSDRVMQSLPVGDEVGSLATLFETSAPARLHLCLRQGQQPDLSAVERLCAERGIELTQEANHQLVDCLVTVGDGAINLLQGEYSPTGQIGRQLRPWRYAAGLLLALLLVEGAAEVVHYQRLKEQVAQLDQRIEQIYRDTFPEARRVERPRVQMEQQLAALRNGGGDSFSRLLGRTAPLLEKADKLTIETLGFRQQRLELEVAIAGFEALDRLKQQLDEVGLEVEINNANAEGGRVRSQLRIREVGA